MFAKFAYCKTITTVRFVNIHHLMFQFVSLVMRTFKIYALSYFPVYNIVLLSIVTMLHITSLEFMDLRTADLYLLTTFT